jgi:hypothetical protein
MSLRHSPTIDDLMADSMIQAVMRADHVEPQALKSLLNGAALRVGAGRRRRALTVFVRSAIERRKTPRGADARPAAGRTARVASEDCGSARCL